LGSLVPREPRRENTLLPANAGNCVTQFPVLRALCYSARDSHGGEKILGHAQSQDQKYEQVRGHFRDHGQDQVFRFWDRLDARERQTLLDQATNVNLEALARAHAANADRAESQAADLEVVPIERLPSRGGDPLAAQQARERGEQALAEGRVCALVVAGGQASRLGFAGPKGLFPVGPVSERTLFEQQAQKLRGLRRRYGKPLPWYIMTSDSTDAATRDFFASADYFGLPKEDVFFFQQGMVQSLDFDGRMILERPDRIFENPDGHGGSLTALLSSGALDDIERRGVDTVFYYQVDNPLIQIADPVYVGFHLAAGAEMSCKVISKRDPMESVGIVARAGGQIGIVEYTEIDDAHRFATDPDGELKYWAGNAAIHLFATSFIRRIAGRADELLPLHASARKIPTVDDAGNTVPASEPNGHKLERFVFDALATARSVCVVEGERATEYSPIKNAEGTDSPASARHDLVALYRAWLEGAGIELPGEGAAIEIDHSQVDSPDEARQLGVRNCAEAGDVIRVAERTTA
jgi:UDP-N-acetylglucosamine/UDP-N-acetylgalactosamine diphosphorylase